MTQEVDKRDTGIILKVTPQIRPDNSVTLEISQEVSERQRTGDGRQQEHESIISQRSIESQITVDSGHRAPGRPDPGSNEQDQERRAGARDVPVLGAAVQPDQPDASRTELVCAHHPASWCAGPISSNICPSSFAGRVRSSRHRSSRSNLRSIRRRAATRRLLRDIILPNTSLTARWRPPVLGFATIRRYRRFDPAASNCHGHSRLVSPDTNRPSRSDKTSFTVWAQPYEGHRTMPISTAHAPPARNGADADRDPER